MVGLGNCFKSYRKSRDALQFVAVLRFFENNNKQLVLLGFIQRSGKGDRVKRKSRKRKPNCAGQCFSSAQIIVPFPVICSFQTVKTDRHLHTSVRTLCSQGDKSSYAYNKGTTLPPSLIPSHPSDCKSPEAVLELINHQLDQGSMQADLIPTTAAQFYEQIYSSFQMPYSLTCPHLQEKWIEFSFGESSAIAKYISDPRWGSFMSFIRSHVGCLPLRDQIQLLSTLSLLFITSENEVFQSLLNNCVANICQLNLHDLAVLSSVIYRDTPNDFVTMGAVVASVHNHIEQTPTAEINLSDLCKILMNVNHVVGFETLELMVEILQTKVEQDQTSVTPGAIIRAFQVLTVCRYYHIQDLPMDSLSKIPEGKLGEDLPILGANLVSVKKYSWPLSYVLKRVSEHCLCHVESSSETLSQTDLMKLSYCLPNVTQETVLSFIAVADFFSLIQLIDHHMALEQEMRGSAHIFRAYYHRLQELVGSLNEAQFERLCNYNNRQYAQVLLKFVKLISSIGIRPDANLQEKIFIASGFDLDKAGCDSTVPVTEFLFHWATNTLSENFLLNHNDLSTLTCLTFRLDLRGMLRIYEQLDRIICMPHILGTVKRQTQKLRSQLQSNFLDRLNRANDLPSSLTLGMTDGERRQEYQNGYSRSRPGLYEDLLSSLSTFVATGERPTHNCLGVLALLDWTSDFLPFYQEMLYEDLTSFVVTRRPQSLTPAVNLLKALASAGYMPRDAELFTAWLWPFVTDLLTIESMDKYLKVKIAHYMSILSLFHDDLICSIFNLSFIFGLHEELKEKPEVYRREMEEDVKQLSRSVAIECPHLAVACLDHPDDASSQYKTSRQDFFNMERMVASIRRICRDDQCVAAPSQSPYCHHIDAELVLDSSFLPIPLPSSQTKGVATCRFERLAFLYGSEQHYCLGEGHHLIGQYQTDIRHLQMLGYNVILLPHYELSSMEMFSDQNLDSLIREKINKAVGIQVFTGHGDESS
ncbi:fast kinase domain-containing protein 1 [Plakobranchus ocellatus]|uniref:Fast kinase domain-containing protein 1 n=1 Tax=Plakobranchus ocellatus TaxID=259542 RepID=A0AAV4CRQ0_9GAST|nr:fast kinase domain-containing protein 1 [Plakobranchus ocellatus]